MAKFPKCVDGLNRLYQYTDGVIHQVVLRRIHDPLKPDGIYLKRVSLRPFEIRRLIRKAKKVKQNEEATNTTDTSARVGAL